jgi:hypothetical protein
MASEFIAGLGAFKAMMDIAKALKDMDTAAARNAAVIELQEKIFAAHSAQAALLERVSELEKEVARFEAWETEKQRYELQKLSPGILIYRLKSGAERGEPSHEICANCYHKGLKSPLHKTGEGNGLTEWKCYACGFHEHSGHFHHPRLDDNSGRELDELNLSRGLRFLCASWPRWCSKRPSDGVVSTAHNFFLREV